MKHLLVVATTNAHKLDELRALLADGPFLVRSASELGVPIPVVVEDGKTFEDNARKKSEAIAAATGALTLADDSGLEVDVLGGAPGVRSARYAHERATDAENNAALIAALEPFTGADAQPIGARFRCVLAVTDPLAPPAHRTTVIDGSLEGRITPSARGSFGFGYDPLFLVQGGDRTLAELSAEEKNRISHRARAFVKMRLVLEKIVAARTATLDDL